MTAPDHLPPFLDRRLALAGAATVGIGVPLLAACSGDDSSTAVDPAARDTAPPSSPATSESPSEDASSQAPDVDALTSASDIEVGGGRIFPDEQVVITQPSEGEFKCFTAVCTHQGCIVSSVSDGDIHCDCHGSAFSIADGSVVNGPANGPLAEQRISVQGDQISLA